MPGSFLAIRMFVSFQVRLICYPGWYLSCCNCRVVVSEVRLSHLELLLAVQCEQDEAQRGLSARVLALLHKSISTACAKLCAAMATS